MKIKAPKGNMIYRLFFCRFCINLFSTNDYWYGPVHKKPITHCPRCRHVCRETEGLCE